MPTSPALLRRGVRYVSLAIAAVGFVAWVVLLRPQALGGPAAYITVAGTSMEPALRAGDLVIVTSAERYERGDVIAYRVPDGDPAAGRTVIHRVIADHGSDAYVVQGDNTSGPDLWYPTGRDIIGRQVLAVPSVGTALVLLQSPAIVALGAAVIVFQLPLWRDRRPVSSEGGRSSRSDPGRGSSD